MIMLIIVIIIILIRCWNPLPWDPLEPGSKRRPAALARAATPAPPGSSRGNYYLLPFTLYLVPSTLYVARRGACVSHAPLLRLPCIGTVCVHRFMLLRSPVQYESLAPLEWYDAVVGEHYTIPYYNLPTARKNT